MTEHVRLSPGDVAPAFTLPDADGLTVPLLSGTDRALYHVRVTGRVAKLRKISVSDPVSCNRPGVSGKSATPA